MKKSEKIVEIKMHRLSITFIENRLSSTLSLVHAFEPVMKQFLHLK